MPIELSVKDVLYAAVLSFFLTWLILNISKMFKIVVTRPTEFEFPMKDAGKILQKCYSLFPREIIQFHGKTFTRGMKVRVTTIQNKTFEGELIGMNHDNMLCLLTNRNVVAHELDKIEEMNVVDK